MLKSHPRGQPGNTMNVRPYEDSTSIAATKAKVNEEINKTLRYDCSLLDEG